MTEKYVDKLVTKEGILSPKVCLFSPTDPRLHCTVTNSGLWTFFWNGQLLWWNST